MKTRMAVSVVTCLLASCLVSGGCTTSLSNAGEVYFEWGTKAAVGHRAEATEGYAESKVDLQPAIDYLIQLREDAEEPADAPAEGSNDDGADSDSD